MLQDDNTTILDICPYLFAYMGPEGSQTADVYIGIILLIVSLVLLSGCLIGISFLILHLDVFFSKSFCFFHPINLYKVYEGCKRSPNISYERIILFTLSYWILWHKSHSIIQWMKHSVFKLFFMDFCRFSYTDYKSIIL